jgi:membrane associated rhomboid family serine protease
MSIAFPRITPWVGRLIAANAVVALLLATVLTSDRVAEALMFTPSYSVALGHPWTFLTYMFVHGGLLHLLGNMVGLYVFGTAVEERMGGGTFIFYYLYCGVGAAIFSLGLSGILPHGVSPFLGASGAVLGVALAFAMFWPDAELLVFPIPIPIRARTLLLIIVGVSAFASLVFWNSKIAHLAHLGGILAGYIFLRVQALSQRVPVTPARQVARVVMVQSSRETERQPSSQVRDLGRSALDPQAVELDRVLDKINEKGIGSLTADERRFLDEVARRKQKGPN